MIRALALTLFQMARMPIEDPLWTRATSVGFNEPRRESECLREVAQRKPKVRAHGSVPPPRRPMHAATKGCRMCTGLSGSGGTARPCVPAKTRATFVHLSCKTRARGLRCASRTRLTTNRTGHRRLGMTGAERMRLSRQRRRQGLRIVPLAVRDDDVAILVVRGFLAAAKRDNPIAIALAMGELLDALPIERWPVVHRR